MLFGRKRSADPLKAQEQAAAMLVTSGALFELTEEEAEQVVAYMHPRRFKAGTVLIREGDTGEDQAMALILSGEVSIENQTPNDSIVVTVLGAGGLLGELALIDESPRSATCTAVTDVGAAVLTRQALAALLEERPGVAARLLMAIGKRVADRLRETNRRLMTLSRVSKAMEQELDATHAVNRRLMRQVEQLQQQQTEAHSPPLADASIPFVSTQGGITPVQGNPVFSGSGIDHDATTQGPQRVTRLSELEVWPEPAVGTLADSDGSAA